MSETLLAGFGEATVTPPLGVSLGGWLVGEGRISPADEVLEDLLVQVLLLAVGSTLVLGVMLADAITLPHDVVAALRRDAAELGATPEVWMIAATHTHSGPDLDPPVPSDEGLRAAPWDPVVIEHLREGARTAVALALGDFAAASVHHGEARCAININRRERGPDGRMLGLPWMGQDPAGPVDRRVNTLRLHRSGDRDIVLASYGCHPAVLGTDSGISPDLFGAARRTAANLLTGAAIMCAQGASGDVNPVIHPGTRDDCERLGSRLGVAIAHAVVEDHQAGEPGPDVSVGTRVLKLPVRSAFPTGLAKMEQDWVTTRRASLAGVEHLPVTLTAARIGGADLVGMPVELFSEIGEELRALAAPRMTLFITHCLGTLGYLPTARAYEDGGYEVLTTPFAPEAHAQLVAAVQSLVAGDVASALPDRGNHQTCHR